MRPTPQRGTKLNVLGPRGGAKSTIGTPGPAAPRGRRVLGAVHLDRLRHQAPGLRPPGEHQGRTARTTSGWPRIFPEVAGRGLVWRDNLIVLRNGVTIEALGTGQRLRGRRRRQHRPTLIVCDDLQNDGHMRSALQREHSRSWFHGTLMKAGTARTNVVNLATALHRDALAMELHRTPGWTSRLFKSIVRWPDNMSLWQQWEAIYTDLSKPRYKTAARKFYEQHRRRWTPAPSCSGRRRKTSTR